SKRWRWPPWLTGCRSVDPSTSERRARSSPTFWPGSRCPGPDRTTGVTEPEVPASDRHGPEGPGSGSIGPVGPAADRWRARRTASQQPVDPTFGGRPGVERVGQSRLTGTGMLAIAVLALVALNPPAGSDRTALVVI